MNAGVECEMEEECSGRQDIEALKIIFVKELLVNETKEFLEAALLSGLASACGTEHDTTSEDGGLSTIVGSHLGP